VDNRSTGATVGATAIASDAVTSTVGLVAEQIDVQEVDAQATPTGAAVTTDAAIAAVTGVAAASSTMATAVAATSADHGKDSTGGKQLYVLSVNLSKAQCVRHEILLRGPSGPERNLIDGSVD
jgi:hypothetical protein